MNAQARGKAPSPRPSPRTRGEGAQALRLNNCAAVGCATTTRNMASFSILAINAKKVRWANFRETAPLPLSPRAGRGSGRGGGFTSLSLSSATNFAAIYVQPAEQTMNAQARGKAPSPRPSPRARGRGAQALRLNDRLLIAAIRNSRECAYHARRRHRKNQAFAASPAPNHGCRTSALESSLFSRIVRNEVRPSGTCRPLHRRLGVPGAAPGHRSRRRAARGKLARCHSRPLAAKSWISRSAFLEQ